MTLRIDGAVPSLRSQRVARVVREVIRAGGQRAEFRVVQFNVLANHLHLLVEAAGQVDLFILASGASDGHVAFCPPGSPADGSSCIVRLAKETRRDNLSTFPEFKSLDDVPHHGLTVGLGTIAKYSKAVAMVIHGGHKQYAAKRLSKSTAFDPQWPATIVHLCRNAAVFLDPQAAETASLECAALRELDP